MDRRKTPDILIERYRRGELSAEAAAALEQEMGPARLALAVTELERSDRMILDEHPARETAQQIRLRASGRRSPKRGATAEVPAGRHRSFGSILPGFSAAAALLLLVVGVITIVPRFETHRPSATPEASAAPFRAKGNGPILSIYRQSGAGAALLSGGDTVRANDVLQIRFNPGSHPFGVILSIDGNHEVTVHLPESSQQSASMVPGQTTTLPFGYRLDNAPGFERFYLVVSDQQFPIDQVLAKARVIAHQGAVAVDRLPLSAAFFQTSIVLTKPLGR